LKNLKDIAKSINAQLMVMHHNTQFNPGIVAILNLFNLIIKSSLSHISIDMVNQEGVYKSLKNQL